MAVRFRDTNIWDEDWYVELGCEMQHLWDYICDKCDHAGIWRPNKSGFEMRAKTKVNLDSFFQKVNGDKERIFRLKDGNWFLTGAIQFQWFNKKKNGFDLVLTNKLHESIFKSLEKHDVPLKKVRGLKEVLQTSKEREKDLISNTDQDIGGGVGEPKTQAMTAAEMFDPNLPEKVFQEYFATAQSWLDSVAKNNGLSRNEVDKILIEFLKYANDSRWLPGKDENNIKRYFVNCLRKEKKPWQNGTASNEKTGTKLSYSISKKKK